MNEIMKSKELVRYEKEAPKLLEVVESLSLVNESDLKISGELMARIKIEKANIKELEDEALVPAKKTVSVIQAWFKPVKEILFKADKIVRDKHSVLSLRLDNERRERERKAELERLERERKAKEKLLKQAEKAQEKGDIEKAEMLKEQEAGYFQPVESMEPVNNIIELESGKTHGVPDIKIVSLDVKHIVQGLAKGVIPIHYLKVVMKDDEPQSLSMTGFKQFMKSKFGNTDQDYYGIRVKKIIRPSVTAGV